MLARYGFLAGVRSVNGRMAGAFLAVVLGIGPAGIVSTRADEPDAQTLTQLRDTLELGSVPYKSSGDRDAAWKKAISISGAKPSDPRVHYARVLLAIELKKTPQALEESAAIIKAFPDYIPGHVARARALLLSSKFDQAIVELEVAAEQLVRPLPATVNEEQAKAAASFIGVFVGYHEGPAPGTVKQLGVTKLLDESDRFASTLKESFEDGRKSVADLHTQLLDQGEEMMDKFRERKAQLEGDADKLRQEMQSRKALASQNAEAAQAQLKATFEQKKAEYQRSYTAAMTSMNMYTTLRQQHTALSLQLSALPPPQPDRNGNISQQDVANYQAAIAAFTGRLNRLENEMMQNAFNYDQQSMACKQLNVQLQQLQAESKNLGMQLAYETQKLEQLNVEAKAKNKAANQVAPKKTPGMLRRERAFSTYDDFSYHREKKCLLDGVQGEV